MAPSFRDQGDFFYPLKLYTADRLRSGEIPLWNPLSGTGEPWLANGQSGVFYPPSLLFLIRSPALAAGLFLLLHFAIAAWGARRFLKEEGVSDAAALLGAAAFAASGFSASLSAYWNHFGAFAYLPGIAAVARAGLRSRSSMLGLAALVGLQAMAGSPEISAATIVLAAGARASSRARRLRSPWRRSRAGARLRRLGGGSRARAGARGLGARADGGAGDPLRPAAAAAAGAERLWRAGHAVGGFRGGLSPGCRSRGLPGIALPGASGLSRGGCRVRREQHRRGSRSFWRPFRFWAFCSRCTGRPEPGCARCRRSTACDIRRSGWRGRASASPCSRAWGQTTCGLPPAARRRRVLLRLARAPGRRRLGRRSRNRRWCAWRRRSDARRSASARCSRRAARGQAPCSEASAPRALVAALGWGLMSLTRFAPESEIRSCPEDVTALSRTAGRVVTPPMAALWDWMLRDDRFDAGLLHRQREALLGYTNLSCRVPSVRTAAPLKTAGAATIDDSIGAAEEALPAGAASARALWTPFPPAKLPSRKMGEFFRAPPGAVPSRGCRSCAAIVSSPTPQRAWSQIAAGQVDLTAEVLLDRAPVPDPAGPESHPLLIARLAEDAPERVVAEVTASFPGLLVLTDLHYPGWIAEEEGRRLPDPARRRILSRRGPSRRHASRRLSIPPDLVLRRRRRVDPGPAHDAGAVARRRADPGPQAQPMNVPLGALGAFGLAGVGLMGLLVGSFLNVVSTGFRAISRSCRRPRTARPAARRFSFATTSRCFPGSCSAGAAGRAALRSGCATRCSSSATGSSGSSSFARRHRGATSLRAPSSARPVSRCSPSTRTSRSFPMRSRCRESPSAWRLSFSRSGARRSGRLWEWRSAREGSTSWRSPTRRLPVRRGWAWAT